MPIAVDAIEEDLELNRQLDELIPPPLTRSRKLAVGASLLIVAVGITVVNLGGYLIPNPLVGISFSSGGTFEVDQVRGVVGARVMIPNNSQRTVRVTSVTLDAPGAELVSVEMALEQEGEVTTTSDGGVESLAVVGPEIRVPLPASIDPGGRPFLILWFRPTSCVDGPPPWGVAVATVDFGEGAFPPFSSTVRIDEDAIWENDSDVTALRGDELISGTGPLAVACEALR